MTWINGKFVPTNEEVASLLEKMDIDGIDAQTLFRQCSLIRELCVFWLKENKIK